MTVSSSVARVQYAGVGTTGPFTVPFRFLDPSHLLVIRTLISTGATTTFALGTDYTVSGTGNPTGSVSLVASLSNLYTLTILRNMPLAQATDYIDNDPLPAETLEQDLDYLTMLVQQLQDQLNRTPSFPSNFGTTLAPVLSQVPVDSTVLMWSGTTGTIVNGPTITNVSTVAANIASIVTVSANIASVNTVATNLGGSNTIGTVAGAIANVNSVGAAISNVSSVAGDLTNINTAAGGLTNINTVATNIANVNTVAGISANVTSVAGALTNINSVASDLTNINNVATDLTNINLVAADLTKINAVQADLTNIDSVAGDLTNINTCASNITSINNASANAAAAAASALAAQAAVVGLANEWNFATSTTMADPGTGNVRFNNATLASVTQIALSALSGDSGNPNLRGYVLTWDDSSHAPAGTLKIAKDATHFAIFGVTSAGIVDNTTWLQLAVTFISSVGTFSAADALELGFIASGSDGTGTLNASGSPATGSLTKWASTTTIANADLTGDVTTAGGVATTIAANAVSNAKFRQGIARSIVGVTGNATANVADIQATANQVLLCPAAGTSLIFGAVTEAMQSITDVTTGNVSTTAHGYAPKAPNDATKYLDGTGAYSRPSIRTTTIASSATPTPNADTTDHYTITALAAAAAFGAPTGTPVGGQRLDIRIKDNGTARALTWNAIFRAGTDVALPTTTVISKTMYVGFIYNSDDTKWDLVASMGNI